MDKSKLRLHIAPKKRWAVSPIRPTVEPEHQVPEPAHPAPNPAPAALQPIVVNAGQERPMPRTIVLTDDIDNNVVEYVAHHLALLQHVSDEPIVVQIHCHGGDLHSSWALYDLLTTSPCPIFTMGYGFIGSGATITFLGGDIRLLAENATFFIHDIQYQVRGSHSKLQEEAKDAFVLRKRIANLYARESGQPKSKILAWMKKEIEMTAQIAIRRGFADRLIPKRKVEVEMRGKSFNRPHTKRTTRGKRI
jgi:ATP-dependent Clp protease, protease subunit